MPMLGPAPYQQAMKIAYDNAYFAWLVSNQDIYGLSERLSFTPPRGFQAPRQGHERQRLTP